jgi:pyridoxamine 5'-phosphate oxidase-like protein
MARWQEIEDDAPEFAAKVKARFEAGTNKTIATLRRDGSPRISGSEAEFRDGEITFGMMSGSMKLRDVRRDPRIAIHSPTIEPPAGRWPGDAKLAGLAVEMPAPTEGASEGSGHFRIDIREATLTYVGEPADHLVIETWHPGLGHERRIRT